MGKIKNILQYSISLFIALMLLTPQINIQTPLYLRSLDSYATIFFLIIAFIHFFYSLKINKLLLLPVIVFLVLVIQMVFLEILFGKLDNTGIHFSIRSIITIVAAYGCAKFLEKHYNNDAFYVFIKALIFFALLQGAVLWLSFFVSDFRELMSVFFYRDLERGADHLILMRVPGFFATGGDGLSMNQALLCTTGLMGMYKIYPQGKFRKILVLFLFFSMLGTTFTGRSGLYLGIFFMTVIVFMQKNGTIDYKKIIKPLMVLSFFILFLFVFSSNLAQYGQTLLSEHGYEYPIVRLLRGFIDMQYSGTYNDRTIQTLLTKMVILPEDSWRFFLGNNDFTNIGSDVGYFRMWHGIGLFGLFIFLWGIFIIPLIQVRMLLYNSLTKVGCIKIRKQLRGYYHMILIIFWFGIIAHYKIFYMTTRVYLFVFFVLLFLIVERYRAANSNSFSGYKPCAV